MKKDGKIIENLTGRLNSNDFKDVKRELEGLAHMPNWLLGFSSFFFILSFIVLLISLSQGASL